MKSERTYLLSDENNDDRQAPRRFMKRNKTLITAAVFAVAIMSAIWITSNASLRESTRENAKSIPASSLIKRHESVPQKRLLYSNIMFRHGDRAPNERAYPNDVYDESYWPNGYGELTELGFEQGKALGRYFRNRYAIERELISKNYVESEVRITASGEDRCIQTAQAFIATLYPDAVQFSKSRILRQLETAPPVHFNKKRMNPMVEAERYFCPTYWGEVLETEPRTNTAIDIKYKSLFKFLEGKTGISQLSSMNVFHVGIFIQDEIIHNLTQPAWVDQFIPELNMTVQQTMLEIARELQDQIYDTPTKAKYLSGLALGKWLDNFQRTISGQTYTPPTKFDIYAVHQGAVKSMLHLLNSGNNQLIPSTACIMVELYKVGQDEYYVETYYRNNTAAEPIPLPLPGCNPTCTFTNFAKIYRQVTFSSENELEQACGLSSAGAPVVMAAIRSISEAILIEHKQKSAQL